MNKFFRLIILVLSLLTFISCSKNEETTKKSESKQITEFAIEAPTGNLEAVINEFEVSITIPETLDISSLTPLIKISNKAAILPLSNTAQDFTNPVNYTVTAEDGTKQVYIVTVAIEITIEKSTKCSITEFSFNQFNPVVTGTITNTNIELVVPIGSDIKKLTPQIVVSDDATISPASDIETDYSSPVIYTVVAEDKTEQKYTVVVNLEKSSENKILEFKFKDFNPELVGIIDNTNNTINVTVPWDEKFDISSMVPTITFSENATVNPESGQKNNFGIEQTYTVTAENQDTRDYAVLVSIEEAPEPTIEALTTRTYSKGDKISIKGTNFSHCKVYLKNTMISLDSETTTEVTFTIPDNSLTALGESKLSLYIRDEKFKLGIINILPGPPSINSLTESYSDKNHIISINGANFSASGNEVFFVKNGQEYKVNIKMETKTKIEVVLNPLFKPGDYTIRVKTLINEVTSTETVEVVSFTTTDLVIAEVNKTSLKKGEKLIISGANLKAGKVQIIIISYNSTITRSATFISETEIEYTIPDDMTSGIYRIAVKLDGTNMESNIFYNITITD